MLHSVWQGCAEEIIKRKGVVMVIGGVDVGKSTFCAALAFHALESISKVAVVDADIGQSDIGPPGTIGLGFAHKEMNSLSDIPLSSFYFVGATSPHGHFLEMVLGTQRMVERAVSQGAEMVIVDTTGLIAGGPARKLKDMKIEALRPSHLVAIQRGRELEHILKGWEGMHWLKIHRIPPSPLARLRSPEERKGRREAKYREHFAKATILESPISSLAFRNAPLFHANPLSPANLILLGEKLKTKIVWGEEDPWELTLVIEGSYDELALSMLEGFLRKRIVLIPLGRLKNTYVGLRDEEGEFLEVGVIESIDFTKGVIKVLTPWREAGKISTISFGTLRISPLKGELENLGR